MHKKKKKKSSEHAFKLVKAQHRNEYLQKLEYWCNTLCEEKVFKHFPTEYLDRIYTFRCRQFKVEIAQGYSVNKAVVKFFEELVLIHSKNEEHLLAKHLPMITVENFFTIGLSLHLIYLDIINGVQSFGKEIDKTLLKLEIIPQNFMVIGDKFIAALSIVGNFSSEINESLHWLYHDMEKQNETVPIICNKIKIYNRTLETKSVTIDGNTRPVIRLGWAFANFGIEYSSITPKQLGIKSQFNEIPMDVYIQSHAIMRLSERIDVIQTGLLHLNIFLSLKNPVICYDQNMRLLIEYRFYGTKVGYFRADIIEGIIVLRTFLFITNNGTPESRKLEQNTGLQKFDIEYLAINKLSSFMNSEIDNNEAVKKILVDANCQCLLELYKKMGPIIRKTNNTFDCESLLEYLKQEPIEMLA